MTAGPGVAAESAIIVEVPEAEPLVGAWRQAHDSSAGLGVPAHVTVLYPFVPPERIGPDTHDALREICAASGPFAAELRSVATFPGDVVYLVPEPGAVFRALTAAVWSRFPDHPPYEGRFGELVPHLTVADTRPEPGRDLAGELADLLSDRLPLGFRVAALSLFVSSGGRWSSTARFALGRTAEPSR